jgi:predicted O-methyltransferase YrrM
VTRPYLDPLRSDRLFAANRAVLHEANRLRPEIAHGSEIPGLIHPREGLTLYVLARRSAHIGNVVEIGAFKGRSTWYLARGLDDAGSRYRVISIDPHDEEGQLEALRTAIRGSLESRVEIRQALSHETAERFSDSPVGLVWIDGDHSYEAVRRDFEDWFPRLEEEGWLAMHDTVNNWYGPTRLARELLRGRADLTRIGVLYMTLFAQKTPPRVRHRMAALGAGVRFELLTLMQARHAGFGAQSGAP